MSEHVETFAPISSMPPTESRLINSLPFPLRSISVMRRYANLLPWIAMILFTNAKASTPGVFSMTTRVTFLNPWYVIPVLCNNGNDKVSFMFSANPGTQLQQVSQVASGGEIARLMLSLKAMISGAVKLPTIIFDEIDTGVSGSIAEKMARIMQEMANNDRQVISITHLPQIAAMGTTHYKVYKEQTSTGTKSNMKKLSADERIKEIAQMLSGSTLTKAALQNAKELLNQI